MVHPDDVLVDDRPGVEFGADVVAGGADHLDPADIGLVVGPGTAEGRQEAVVDVDQPALPRAAQLGGDDLHVPGQHDRVRRVRVDLAPDLVERRRLALVVAGDRDVPERQAEQPGDRLEVGVIADDDADVGRHLLGVPAGQQLVQAVPLLGDQQHHRLPVGAVGDLPGIGR